MKLDWKFFVRDCSFYFVVIVGIVVIFNGGRVNWWEGFIYVFFYCLYIVFMWKNVYFMKFLDDKFGDYFGRSDAAVEMEEVVGGGFGV